MFIPFEIFQIMIYKEWNNLPYFKVQTQIDYFENNKQKIFDNLPCHLESIISKNTVLFVNCERKIQIYITSGESAIIKMSMVENTILIQEMVFFGVTSIQPQNPKIWKNTRGILENIIHLMLVKFRNKMNSSSRMVAA